MAKLLEANDHIHDFDLVGMKPSDTFWEARSTLNGANSSLWHDHEVFVRFDFEKKKFIVNTAPGGKTFQDQHIHPEMEIDLGSLESRPTTRDSGNVTF